MLIHSGVNSQSREKSLFQAPHSIDKDAWRPRCIPRIRGEIDSLR